MTVVLICLYIHKVIFRGLCQLMTKCLQGIWKLQQNFPSQEVIHLCHLLKNNCQEKVWKICKLQVIHHHQLLAICLRFNGPCLYQVNTEHLLVALVHHAAHLECPSSLLRKQLPPKLTADFSLLKPWNPGTWNIIGLQRSINVSWKLRENSALVEKIVKPAEQKEMQFSHCGVLRITAVTVLIWLRRKK